MAGLPHYNMNFQEPAGPVEEPGLGLAKQANDGQPAGPEYIPLAQQDQHIPAFAPNQFPGMSPSTPIQCNCGHHSAAAGGGVLMQDQNMSLQPHDLMRKLRDWEWVSMPGILEYFKNSYSGTNFWDDLIDINPDLGCNALHLVIADGRDPDAPIGPHHSNLQNVDNLEDLRLKIVKGLLNAVPAERRQEAVEKRNVWGQTALFLAAKHRITPMIDYLVTKEGANVNTQDEYGKTPLQYTAERLDSDIARLLYNHGANPSIYDNSLSTTLHELEFVCAHSGEETAKDLLELMQQTPIHIPSGPSTSLMSTCLAFGGFYRGHNDMNVMTYSMPDVPLGDTFRGSLFKEICRRQSLARPAAWLSCWIHLPENNVCRLSRAT